MVWDFFAAIIPLTEMSVAKKCQTIDFPDFTRGKWKTRLPFEAEYYKGKKA